MITNKLQCTALDQTSDCSVAEKQRVSIAAGNEEFPSTKQFGNKLFGNKLHIARDEKSQYSLELTVIYKIRSK